MVRIAEVVPPVVFKNVVRDPNASPHKRKSVARSVDIFTTQDGTALEFYAYALYINALAARARLLIPSHPIGDQTMT